MNNAACINEISRLVEMDKPDLSRLYDLVEGYNGWTGSQEKVTELLEEALEHLDGFDPDRPDLDHDTDPEIMARFDVMTDGEIMDIAIEESMMAMSVRQPYADEILSGEKVFEHRSQPGKVTGWRILYASENESTLKEEGLDPADFYLGCLVGVVYVDGYDTEEGAWRIARAIGFETAYERPDRQPQPLWWRPYPE